MVNPLDPALKIKYADGAPVQIALAGNPKHLLTGRIVGFMSEHVIDTWAVELDAKLPDWDYRVIPVQHTFIRPMGSNEPFLCEQVHGR